MLDNDNSISMFSRLKLRRRMHGSVFYANMFYHARGRIYAHSCQEVSGRSQQNTKHQVQLSSLLAAL